MNTEQYIEHEVKLRVHEHQLKTNGDRFKCLEGKLNFIIGIGLSSIILPVILHYLGLV